MRLSYYPNVLHFPGGHIRRMRRKSVSFKRRKRNAFSVSVRMQERARAWAQFQKQYNRPINRAKRFVASKSATITKPVTSLFRVIREFIQKIKSIFTWK